eukprot:768603-Hanusia_phi.AAC.4
MSGEHADHALPQNPTQEELQEMIREVDEDGNEQIEFDEFVQIIAKHRKDVDLEKEILDEFTDKENGVDRQETGFCSLNDLRLNSCPPQLQLVSA